MHWWCIFCGVLTLDFYFKTQLLWVCIRGPLYFIVLALSVPSLIQDTTRTILEPYWHLTQNQLSLLQSLRDEQIHHYSFINTVLRAWCFIRKRWVTVPRDLTLRIRCGTWNDNSKMTEEGIHFNTWIYWKILWKIPFILYLFCPTYTIQNQKIMCYGYNGTRPIPLAS